MEIESINNLVKIDFQIKIKKLRERKHIYEYAPQIIPKLSENAKKLSKEKFTDLL